MSEFEASTKTALSLSRRPEPKREKDLQYLILHEMDWFSALTVIVVIILYITLPVSVIVSYTFFSGGMQWILILFTVTVLALLSIYLMKRGVRVVQLERPRVFTRAGYEGELTKLTDTMDRASSGYAYSQQLVKERLADILAKKLGKLRDLDQEEIDRMLEKGDTAFVGDEFLAQFLQLNWRGAENWDAKVRTQKGKSKERGRRFMLEIGEVIEAMEAIV
jgi:hypothetical protein